MTRCEHCGSPLPDGAIFCGECGRAATGASARRAAARESTGAGSPTPLQSPGPHGVVPRRPNPEGNGVEGNGPDANGADPNGAEGRRAQGNGPQGAGPRDPAAEAWLPEATLDPATRAWLTADRGGASGTGRPTPAQPPADRSADAAGPDDRFAPRSAPTHVHGAGSGLGDWTGRAPTEPTLDPDAFAAEPPAGGSSMQPRRMPHSQIDPDTESTVEAPRPNARSVPEWRVPEQQAPPTPSAPSWWIDRGPSAAIDPEPERPAAFSGTGSHDGAGASTGSSASDGVGEPDRSGSEGRSADTDGSRSAGPSSRSDAPDPSAPADPSDDSGPRSGDTAIVPPLLTPRQAPRPFSLVAPGVAGATCHVCGHLLEPDDIFCEECGAVVTAVTAAYTGPIVPLTSARPDWSVTDDDDLGSVLRTPDAAGEPTAPADTERDATDTDAAVSDAADAADSDAADADPADSDEAAAPSHEDGPQVVAVPQDEPERHDAQAAAQHAQHETATAVAPQADRTGGTTPVRPDAADDAVSGPAPRNQRSEDDDEPAAPRAAPLPPITVGSTDSAEPGDDAEDVTVDDSDEDADEDVDATRIVTKAPEAPAVVLHFSTGERVDIAGTGLIGRLPRPAAGERYDELVTIVDTGKSVSKTHLEVGRDGDDLWVADRNSGNGTVVRHVDGSIRRCEPGRRYRVERGARVDIGEQFFLVQ